MVIPAFANEVNVPVWASIPIAFTKLLHEMFVLSRLFSAFGEGLVYYAKFVKHILTLSSVEEIPIIYLCGHLQLWPHLNRKRFPQLIG